MSHSLRVIFAGSSDIAAYHLAELINSSHKIIGILTQPDRPAGRGNCSTATAVKQCALQHDLPIFQPTSLRCFKERTTIAKLNPDIMVVVAYALILPQEILDLPKLGCINVHGSLLPRWRGAAPIQRAIWAGDTQTGVTIIQMDPGLDSGAILYQESWAILPMDTSATLHAKLAVLGPKALLTTLGSIGAGKQIAESQEHSLATYAKKLTKKEARLDWKLSAVQQERCIRAFNPWPVSYFQLGDTQIKVWQGSAEKKHHGSIPGTVLTVDKSGIKIATGDGVLTLTLLQPAAKKIMPVQDFLNSRSTWFVPGSILD